MKIKVRQLIVSVQFIPWLKFDSRIKGIELYDDEFSFYDEEIDTYVEQDGGKYFVEWFFPSDMSYSDILVYEKRAKDLMIKHFQNKIEFFEKLMIEVKSNI